ncbi:MAG: DUF4382 domain-containing protein [Bacteroidota bacterium]
MNRLLSILILAFIICFTSCAPLDPAGETGRLRVLLTDEPFPAELVESANVTISKAEGRNQSDNEGNPFLTLTEGSVTYNLLDLQNGVTAELADLEVPVGTYDLIRLFVSNANLTLSSGISFDLTVPSGAETGIKLFIDPPIEVVSGSIAALILDFDARQSFVALGSLKSAEGINGFIFRPVIRAENISTTGRIAGTVTDASGAALEDVTVSATQNGVVVSTTGSSSEGTYTLMALPAGEYTVTAEKQGYSSAQQDVITVVVGNVTAVNFQLSPS